jgi:hypothetical protein
MREIRNDIEPESTANRETAFTQVTFAWAFVLIILFVITSTPPQTESRSLQFSIRGSLGEGDISAPCEGECVEGVEMLRASVAMSKAFAVARRMIGKAWADPQPFEMTATFAGKDGRPLLTIRMVLVSEEPRNPYAQDHGGWRLASLQ